MDLFAGTGSMSYEFASRGCPVVDLVEFDYKSYSFIKKTIQELQISNITPYLTDVYKYINHCRNQYDLIFADPPYRSERIAELPELIMKHDITKQKGWFILEHSGKFDFSERSDFREKRTYGSVNFSVFAK